MYLTWTGSDVLFATSFPKHSRKIKYVYMLGMRLFAKLADKFVQKHVVVSEHLIKELTPLRLKKPIEVRNNPVFYPEPFEKKKHRTFNLIYYYPGDKKNRPFNRWLYGYDIMLTIKEMFPKINIIVIDGSLNMKWVYPFADFCARPNRHDGDSRMIRECQINNIPYYHSKENPSLKELHDKIKYHFEKWRDTQS